jgi:hypothetical protein
LPGFQKFFAKKLAPFEEPASFENRTKNTRLRLLGLPPPEVDACYEFHAPKYI